MVKSNFFKKYSKPLALLAILIILTIVLFSCVNNYSIENFRPKPNIKMEIYLWVGPGSFGSAHNDLVQRWLDFTKAYGNIPNVTLGRAKASEFTKYLELDKYPELNIDTNEFLKPLKSVDLTKDNQLFPFVSVFFVGTQQGKTFKNSFGLLTGKEVTYDALSKAINGLTFMFYDSLYESDVNIAPAIPAVPKLPETSKETSKETPKEIPSLFKLPGT